MPKVIYKTKYGTRFKVDGDLTRTLEVEGSKGYVLDWVREKLINQPVLPQRIEEHLHSLSSEGYERMLIYTKLLLVS